ncbi:hypothetical protein [Halalkalibacter kiskunsagensis]
MSENAIVIKMGCVDYTLDEIY